jgi:hypothetical protein
MARRSCSALMFWVALGIAACSKGDRPVAVTSGTGAAPATPGRAPMLHGDSAGIRHYLETVDTMVGATFDVTWNANTVRLDRATTLRSLRQASSDGTTFTFASDEPAIRGLKPGQVLLVWGVALLRVTSVEPVGGYLVVQGTPASLPEAMDQAHIAWRTPARFDQGMLVEKVAEPDPVTVSLGRPAGAPWLLAGWHTPAAEAMSFAVPAMDSSEKAPSGGGYTNKASGDIGGFAFEVAYAFGNDALDFELEASMGKGGTSEPDAGKSRGDDAQDKSLKKAREDLEAGRRKTGTPAPDADADPAKLAAGAGIKSQDAADAWKKERSKVDAPGAVWGGLMELTSGALWGIAKEQLDLRIKARGHLTGFGTEGDITIANAQHAASQFSISNLDGIVDLSYIARLGKDQGSWTEKFKVSLPITFNIPVIIGGVPFMLQLAMNFMAIPGLSGHYATMTGKAHLNFSGTGTIQVGRGNTDASGNFDGGAFIVPDRNEASSLGVSAVLVAAQFPRVGFGLGLFNSYSIAYIDLVGTASLTNAGKLALLPCLRTQLNAAVGAGVATDILGIKDLPGIGGTLSKKINGALSWKKSPPIWTTEKSSTWPPGLKCDV